MCGKEKRLKRKIRNTYKKRNGNGNENESERKNKIVKTKFVFERVCGVCLCALLQNHRVNPTPQYNTTTPIATFTINEIGILHILVVAHTVSVHATKKRRYRCCLWREY
jgi:hypothetical protein